MPEQRVGSLGGEAPGSHSTEAVNGGRRISRKMIAVMIAAILLGVSGFYLSYNYIWYSYIHRAWTIGDLENAVLTWDYEGTNSAGIDLGFKTYLEGRTVTVKGTVSRIGSADTSLGQLNRIYLEGGTFVYLTQWGSLDFSEGDRIEMIATFERGTLNGEEHIYSPQVGFPGYGVFFSSQTIVHSVSWVSGGNWLIDGEDLGDDLIIRVDRTADPLPLEMARCDIKKGTSRGITEYIDSLGFYDENPEIDAIPVLTDGLGLNGTIEFTDENSDGYIDDGDFITVRGLTRPATVTGAQTYLLSVERDQYPDEYESDRPIVFAAYLIMTSEGLLWTISGDAPFGTSFVHGTEDGAELVVDYISEPVSWDNTSLLITDGMDFETCHPSAEMLSQGPLSSYSCGTLVFRDFQLDCTVIDVAGDGLLGEGDRVELLAANGTKLEPGDVIDWILRSDIVHTEIIRDQFTCGIVPTSDCETEYVDDNLEITLAPLHNGTGIHYEQVDVPWDDLLVVLEDGADAVEWHPASEDLNAPAPDSWDSDPTALGGITLVCSVHDLQGNGLANTGDAVLLSPTGEDEFDPETDYTVTLVHIPTGAVIYSTSFVGQR